METTGPNCDICVVALGMLLWELHLDPLFLTRQKRKRLDVLFTEYYCVHSISHFFVGNVAFLIWRHG